MDLPFVEPVLLLLLGTLSRLEATATASATPETFTTLLSAICELIKLCGRPFEIPSSTAALHIRPVVLGLVTTLGELLLTSPQSMVKTACAEALTGFIGVSKSRRDWEGNQALFAESGGVAKTVECVRMEVMHLFAHDADGDGMISESEYAKAHNWGPGETAGPSAEVFMVAAMRLMRAISEHESNAFAMVRADGLQPLVKVVSCLEDFRKQEVRIMLQVLWNVLEHSVKRLEGIGSRQVAGSRQRLLDKHRSSNALYVLGNVDTVRLLKSFLENMLRNGYRLEDKQLRNEVVIVASTLAQREENAKPFLHTGFVELLVEAVAPKDVQAITHDQKRYYLSPHPYDVEFKKLVMFLVCQLCESDEEVRQVVQQSTFVPALITLLDPACKRHPLRCSYKQTYLVSVQLDALRVLAELAKSIPYVLDTESFVRMINVLTALHEERQLLEEKPHLTTELEHNLQLSLEALRFFLNVQHLECFRSALESQPDFAAILVKLAALGERESQFLGSGTGMGTSTSMVKKTFHPHASVETRVYESERPQANTMKLKSSVTLRETALGLLASLARTMGFDDVAFVCSRLEFDHANFAQTACYLSFALSLLAEVVLKDAGREFEFASKGGCERLLELMQQGPTTLVRQIVGILTDLVENPFARNCLLAWRSPKSSQTALQIVLDNVANQLCPTQHAGNNQQDVDCSLREPFEKLISATQTNGSEGDGNNSNALDASKAGCIAKLREALERSRHSHAELEASETEPLQKVNKLALAVYVFFDALGFDSYHKEHHLSFLHLKILTTLSAYKSLARGHVWRQVKQGMENNGLTPIPPDAALLEEEITGELQRCREMFRQLDVVDKKEAAVLAREDQLFYRKILKRKGLEMEAKLHTDRVRRRQTERLKSTTVPLVE